ncbi:hypothetical protein [Ammoniphilus sp. 3BR4]|uniref:hypothetical protein n=1 Tax=Ammoniphilus sp. 3BR4 TaxID=3158265 RepID=UPI003465BF87
MKKKNGDSYKMPIKDTLVVTFFILLSGSLFVHFLTDLPNVLADKTERYEGNCEIVIFSGRGGRLEANFEDRSIIFPTQDYRKAEEGNYYCEVEYYPRTEQGKSLKLYESKGGKAVKIK